MCDACTPEDRGASGALSRRRFLANATLLGLAASGLRLLPEERARSVLGPRSSALADDDVDPASFFATAGAERTLRVIPRRAWGAEPVRGNLRRHSIHRITVHHSAAVLRDNSDAPAHFRSHQRAHFANGWPDIAYHLLIDRRGNIYEGRARWAEGDTRTNYDPRGHLLILCEGNFDVQRVGDAQLPSMVDLVMWARRRYGVRRRRVRYHGFYAATACPGAHMRRQFASGRIRRMMARRAEIDYRFEMMSYEDGRRRVRRIENG